MYDHVCKVCGKPFKSRMPKATICGEYSCKKIADKEYKAKRREEMKKHPISTAQRERNRYIKYRVSILKDMSIPKPSKEELDRVKDLNMSEVMVDAFFRGYMYRNMR